MYRSIVLRSKIIYCTYITVSRFPYAVISCYPFFTRAFAGIKCRSKGKTVRNRIKGYDGHVAINSLSSMLLENFMKVSCNHIGSYKIANDKYQFLKFDEAGSAIRDALGKRRFICPRLTHQTMQKEQRHKNSPGNTVFPGLPVYKSLGERIRTSGLLNPIQARYQAAPHPDVPIGERDIL